MGVIILALLVTLLAGCSTATHVLTDPLYITCKGKGWTNIMLGPYSGRVESDCGEGFEYSLERKKK